MKDLQDNVYEIKKENRQFREKIRVVRAENKEENKEIQKNITEAKQNRNDLKSKKRKKTLLCQA